MDRSPIPYLISTPLITKEWDWIWERPWDSGSEPGSPLPLLVVSLPRGPEEQSVLDKMMQACSLEPGQFQVLTMEADQRIPWPRIREKYHPENILLLGILPAQMGILAQFRIHHPNTFDQRTWIPALGLKEMPSHPEHKKALWTLGLKPIFASKGENQK